MENGESRFGIWADNADRDEAEDEFEDTVERVWDWLGMVNVFSSVVVKFGFFSASEVSYSHQL